MRNQGQFVLYFLLPLLSTCVNFSEAGNAARAPNSARLIRVDPSGKGDFARIQDAIDAVPSNNSEPLFIRVEPGTYREKVVVPADKPFVTLSGRSASSTIITGDDSGDIFGSPTVSVLASDFVGRYLTIQVRMHRHSKSNNNFKFVKVIIKYRFIRNHEWNCIL